MKRLSKIEFLNGYRIRLYFSDDFVAEVDFEPYLQKGFARELLNRVLFKQGAIESGGGLAWSNGFDFCPNYLYEISKKQIAAHA